MNEDQQNTTSSEEFTYFTPYSVDIFSFDNPVDIQNYISRFKSASGTVRDLIFNPSTADFIQEDLVPKFNLNTEQGKEVTRIIRDILLADIFIGDVIGAIQTRLKVDQNTASSITSMLISDLFAPVIEEIKSMHKEKFGDRLRSIPKPTSEVNTSLTSEVTRQEPLKPMSLKPEIQFKPREAPTRTFSNPAANLDLNEHNILDLRNKK